MKRIVFASALLACVSSAEAATVYFGSLVVEQATTACSTVSKSIVVGAVWPAALTPRSVNLPNTTSFLFMPGPSVALLLSATGDFDGSATHTLKIMRVDGEDIASSTNTLLTAPLSIAAATKSVTVTGIIRNFGAAGCHVTVRGAFTRNPVDQ